MLDIQFIRNNAELVKQKSKQKQLTVDVDKLLNVDQKRRELLLEIEKLRAQRNEANAQLKNGKPTDQQLEQGKQLKEKLTGLEEKLQPIEAELQALMLTVPNMPLDDVPIGQSENDNVVTKTVGEIPVFDFEPKSHIQIGDAKGWIDKERAAKVAGSRFVYLKGDLVLLEFALWQFALSVLTSQEILQHIIHQANLDVPAKPFVPVLPPAVAKTAVYEATSRLDKEQQTYKLADDDLWLNASAEHTLAPMYLDEILEEKTLPLRYVGYTTAFRREAGTYGKDMEGILRLHQFNKLEMESFTIKEKSLDEHLFMIAIQEYLMQQLGLPYQVLNKCTADIGKPNARGVDIEVWLPSQNKYRETHTADLITDYQTRRMRTRVRREGGTIEFPHTNDATAFAERPLIAIIENFQTKDGDVIVPEVLRSYLGKDKI